MEIRVGFYEAIYVKVKAVLKLSYHISLGIKMDWSNFKNGRYSIDRTMLVLLESKRRRKDRKNNYFKPKNVIFHKPCITECFLAIQNRFTSSSEPLRSLIRISPEILFLGN
jgi:hypothetical protein